MKKIVVSKQRQSREQISNPNANESLKVRQKKSRCVSYGKNKTVKDLGNGYSQIISRNNKNP